MSNELALVQVNVCGSVIEAGKTVDGHVFVPTKKVCEALWIDDDAQRIKLQGSPWATALIIKAVAADGKLREVFCVDLDSLPMWLVTIHVSKVKPEARATLVAFQKEAKRVLANYFFGRQAPFVDSVVQHLMTEVADLRGQIAELRKQQLPQRRYSMTKPFGPGLERLGEVVQRVLSDHPEGLTTNELLEIARDEIETIRGRKTLAVPLGRELSRIPDLERRWRHGHVSLWALRSDRSQKPS